MILDIIKPITLLEGHHNNTNVTGSGCFMNVIAYLNGDPVITDNSPCVCCIVRPIVIWFNDYLFHNERNQLLPFVERALGSATDDKDELITRGWLAVNLANDVTANRTHACSHLTNIIAEVWASRAQQCANAARQTMEYASYLSPLHIGDMRAVGNLVFETVNAVRRFHRRDFIKDAVFAFLDNALPKNVDVPSIVLERAKQFVELSHDTRA